MKCLAAVILSAAWVFIGSSVSASVLESPASGASLSGVGFISGWKCDAGALTVRIDGGAPLPVLYGNDRLDTHVSKGGPCQRRDTGYILQINWAELGDDLHTVVAYDNGHEFARATFTVATTGEAFLRGASGSCEIADFPAPGETATFVWNEATQHLELTTAVSPTDPAQPDCSGWSSWEAFETATPAWVVTCLAAGVDVHATDGRGSTPLHHAADWGKAEIVQLLLDAGADATASREPRLTWTPLHSALEGARNPEVVRLLLDAGADPHTRAGRDTAWPGLMPVFMAGRNSMLLNLFLDAGANPRITNDRGETLLHWAVDDVLLVRRLLAAGTPLDRADRYGWTPLLQAARRRANATAQLLLERGASVTAFQVEGFTALHFAAINGNAPLAALLLRYGANPRAPDHAGRTPLDWAERQGHEEVARLLRGSS